MSGKRQKCPTGPLSDALKTRRPPLPLVIAVVGHRDLIREDEGRLREQAGKIFDDLTKYYPSSTPFRLLSGLAEGADRVIAHEALKRGVHLVACLPMKRSLYENDFSTEESRQEFHHLLEKSVGEPYEIQLVSGNTSENVGEEDRRALQYEALGKFLVEQCHILIALWDGVDTGLIGGTSSVVSLQRFGPFGENGIDPRNPLPFPECGPVFHILTPRGKNPAPVGELHERKLLPHRGSMLDGEAQKKFEKTLFQRANAFNEHASRLRAKSSGVSAQSEDWLMPKDDRCRLDGAMRALIRQYAEADALALSYQRRTRWTLRALIFVFGLLGVLSLELFAHGPETIQTLCLSIYLGFIIVAFILYRVANFRDIKTRHLDYRALAEGLRLQIFWKLAGLQHRVVDYYLAKQRTDLDWVRDAIRRWSEPVTPLKKPDWELVGVRWIRNQFEFFSRAAGQNKKWHFIEHLCYVLLTFLVFAIGMGIIVAHGFDLWGLRETFHDVGRLGVSRHGLLVIAMTMLPAVAAAITAYSLKMAYREQRKQYERMRELYQRGLFCFEKAIQSETAERDDLVQRVVFELGQEALSENGDWVLMHRERVVEMFVGG